MTVTMLDSAPDSAASFFEQHRAEMAVKLGHTFDHKNACALKEQSPAGKEVLCTGSWVQAVRDTFASHVVSVGSREFHVSTRASMLSSQSQERPTGSDLVIFFEVRGVPPHPCELIKSKTLLVQAKSGEQNGMSLEFGDSRLLGQMRAIQAITGNDGYLLVFTPEGARCVSLEDAFKSLKRGRVKTSKWHSSSYMLESVANCTFGNNEAVSPRSLGALRRPDGRIDLDDANRRLVGFARAKLASANQGAGGEFTRPQAVALSLEIKE